MCWEWLLGDFLMLSGEGFLLFFIILLCAAQTHKMPGRGFKMEYSPGMGKDRRAAKAAIGKATS